jgi:hypothetical protein
MDVSIETIGSLSKVAGGSDQYVLLSCNEDTSASELQNWLWEHSIRKSIGAHFHTRVTVMPHAEVGKFIGIIHKR